MNNPQSQIDQIKFLLTIKYPQLIISIYYNDSLDEHVITTSNLSGRGERRKVYAPSELAAWQRAFDMDWQIF